MVVCLMLLLFAVNDDPRVKSLFVLFVGSLDRGTNNREMGKAVSFYSFLPF